MARKRALQAIHPGEVLREEFMKPMGIKAYSLARDLQIERPRLERIVREEQGISADTALRLGKFFGTTPEFWMNLQARYELQCARRQLGARLNKIESHSAAAA